jgi:ABC-type polysaccharide/polyol phosphate export permease
MTNKTALRCSFNIHIRVVKALLMREVITRYGRHNIGFLWLFIEPMLLTLGVTVFWHYTFKGNGGTLSVTAFAVTGYSCIQLWRTTAGRCIFALSPNLSLLYHRNVGVLEIYLARIVLELVGVTSAFAFMTILFSVTGLMPPPDDVLPIMLGWFLLGWFGASLGLLLGAASELSELVERVWHPVSYLLFPLSGAMFLVDWLPSSVQPLAILIPMVSASELIRLGYFGNAITAHFDISWVVVVNMLQTMLGLFLCKVVERRVEHE